MRLLLSILLIFFAAMLPACKTTTLEQQFQGQTDKQIFDRAQHNLKREHYAEAIKDFEALDTLYPFGEYAQQAQLDIIYAYYKNSDTDSALAAADRYIRLYPRSPGIDYAYYMRGLINLGPPSTWLDRWVRSDYASRDITGMDEAYKDFATLIKLFPESPYASEAKKRMAIIYDALATHQLQIAQYYFRRKAYVAAANRASELVIKYPGTPQVTEALEIMVESYRALGENNLASDALKTLQTNYPNSPEAKRLALRPS